MLNMYLITIPYQGYDTYDAHVVRAVDPVEVVKLAQSVRGGEGVEIWDTAEASISYLGVAYSGSGHHPREAGIVCSSFNAG